MATEIKVPALGENVDSATLVKILVSVGDTITEDQPIMELETEKASAELPASASGTVKEIRVKEGETIKVGQVILTLEEGGEPKEAKGKTEQQAQPEAKPEEAISEKDQEEKTKASPPPKRKAEASAEPQKVEAKPEEEKQETLPKREEKVEPVKKEEPQPAPEPTEEVREPGPAAPSLRRMARELGVDINEVTGTGPAGRVTENDVRNYARSIILNASGLRAAIQPPRLPDFSRWGEVERKAMTGVRRKTAEHLQDAWTSIPHVTHFDFADITELEQLRESFSKKVEEAGGKLTITAIVLKIIAAALKAFPQFNASLDATQEEIIYKKYYHIGVAVDTDRGLLVPVIRDVDKKNILDLSVELTQAAEKARDKKLTLEEMQGGTFTITNLGGIGGTSFTPIINSPEVGILGISRASQQPVFNDGQFKPRLMLPLALSYDHRVIDGADAARFLRWVGEALQQPFMLTLEG
jgi:pyruvate dehydrogenase E2 component (dihydrolipoamide acetyltransferase)